MVGTLDLALECAGCATVCQHCWARGRHYPSMPLADIQMVLESAQRFCTTYDLALAPYPMHDVLMHPHASDVLRLCQAAAGNDILFDPLPTTGVPLLLRDDWQAVLETARTLGTTTLWFAFHGVDAVHDQMVGYPGAYHLSLEAVRRAQHLGFTCGANVFVTNATIPQLEALFSTLAAVGMTELACEVAGYSPVQRLRRGENERPTLTTLRPVAPLIIAHTTFHREWWSHVEDASEAWYYRQATAEQATLRGGWQLPPSPDRYPVVCDRHGGLATGWSGLPGQVLGNLRTDDSDSVFAKAIASPVHAKDAAALYFARTDEPAIKELAQLVGDPNGEQVYMNASEVRLRWLDRIWHAYRRH